MKLDPINIRILEILQLDSDQPLDVLSEKVNLSRNACWRRIKMMEEEGWIKGRVVLLDPVKLGLGLSVFIQVRTDNHNADWMGEFAKAVRDMPQITGAFRMTGDLDYLLHVQVGDMADYDNFYKKFIAKVRVSDMSASFVMERVKETTALPLSVL
jgi:Lrp/AsnC family transcriptional regulator